MAVVDDPRSRRTVGVLLIAGALLFAGCGSDDEETPVAAEPQGTTAVAPPTTAERDRTTTAPSRGTRIVVSTSPFGRMLFDAKRRAIYIFENDSKDKSVCYGKCAQAWPPVYTDGPPVAAQGVDASLLGTVKRRDGRRQVSYAGQPLYYYAHEEPGEVRCHNVDLNGGLWWVVGADGKRRP